MLRDPHFPVKYNFGSPEPIFVIPWEHCWPQVTLLSILAPILGASGPHFGSSGLHFEKKCGRFRIFALVSHIVWLVGWLVGLVGLLGLLGWLGWIVGWALG